MQKKNKILIVISASMATSLLFAVPWFANHMRYEEDHKIQENSYKERYGEVPSALSGKRLDEASQVSKRNLAMTMCLNRYRNENLSFAPSLTACKQELLYDLTR